MTTNFIKIINSEFVNIIRLNLINFNKLTHAINYILIITYTWIIVEVSIRLNYLNQISMINISLDTIKVYIRMIIINSFIIIIIIIWAKNLILTVVIYFSFKFNLHFLKFYYLSLIKISNHWRLVTIIIKKFNYLLIIINCINLNSLI